MGFLKDDHRFIDGYQIPWGTKGALNRALHYPPHLISGIVALAGVATVALLPTNHKGALTGVTMAAGALGYGLAVAANKIYRNKSGANELFSTTPIDKQARSINSNVHQRLIETCNKQATANAILVCLPALGVLSISALGFTYVNYGKSLQPAPMPLDSTGYTLIGYGAFHVMAICSLASEAACNNYLLDKLQSRHWTASAIKPPSRKAPARIRHDSRQSTYVSFGPCA